jgi:general secretion pathway protein L
LLLRLAAWLESVQTWASPGEAVLLLRTDGSKSTWRSSQRLSDGAGKPARFVAIELPEDLVLRRSLLLPRMSAPDAAKAILLDVTSNSPFAPDDVAWGSRLRNVDGGGKHVDVALTSRGHVAGFLQERWPELAAVPTPPEVWALSPEGFPVVISGYGESRRFRAAAMQSRWNWVLLALALALATLAAVTPTLQLRLRSLEAAVASEALMRRVGPLVRKRDELAALNDKIRSMGVLTADRVDPAGVIEYLTKILPDDTYLYSLDIQKTKITASGHTPDASAVLQKLSSDPRLKNVRSPTAVTRIAGATKEAFVVEFTMEPVRLVTPLPVALPAPAIGALPVGTASGIATVTAPAMAASSPVAVTAAGSPPAPVVAPTVKAPAGSSPFVIGGSR